MSLSVVIPKIFTKYFVTDMRFTYELNPLQPEPRGGSNDNI